jgi:hypothetical protein
MSLDVELPENVSLVAKSICSTAKYASKLINAVKTGTEGSLFVRQKQTQRHSILTTDWPQQLREYAVQPENARACPGISGDKKINQWRFLTSGVRQYMWPTKRFVKYGWQNLLAKPVNKIHQQILLAKPIGKIYRWNLLEKWL